MSIHIPDVGKDLAMITKGYQCMFVEETFMVYLYGTDEEISHFKTLIISGDLNSISRLVTSIRNRI